MTYSQRFFMSRLLLGMFLLAPSLSAQELTRSVAKFNWQGTSVFITATKTHVGAVIIDGWKRCQLVLEGKALKDSVAPQWGMLNLKAWADSAHRLIDLPNTPVRQSDRLRYEHSLDGGGGFGSLFLIRDETAAGSTLQFRCLDGPAGIYDIWSSVTPTQARAFVDSLLAGLREQRALSK